MVNSMTSTAQNPQFTVSATAGGTVNGPNTSLQ